MQLSSCTVDSWLFNQHTAPKYDCPQLDFDTLQINMLPTESDSHAVLADNSATSPKLTADDLNHCPDLLQYVIKVKNTKHKFIALLDPGSGVSCIRSDIASAFQDHKSPLILHAGLAASDESDKSKKIVLDSFVNLDFKIGNFNDSYNFRVFPNLRADIILGLDWMVKRNPLIPDWNEGVMYITRKHAPANKRIKKFKSDVFKIKPLKGVIPVTVPVGKSKFVDKAASTESVKFNKSGKPADSGLISALEVSKSSDWECMLIFVNELDIHSDEELQFYKPHFEEPPLYKQSEPLTEYQQQLIDKLKEDNKDVLKVKLPTGVPPHRKGDGPIAPTPPGVQPIKKSAYNLSPSQNLEIKRQLTEYINKGYLQPSHSPWGAPVFLVKKPHSDLWRMVCDWRGLNKLTIKDRFEIPNPALLFDKLGGSKYFTKLDLAQGYHQLALSEDDRIKSAIVTRYGSYEWTVASFGMSNVPSVFQRVLGNVLFEYTDDFVVNFFDDILIYTKEDDIHTHIKHIQLVLNKLREAQLYVNPEKCTWMATSVPYLGFEISAEGIRCSKEKVQAVNDWPIPKNVKQVKQFLGLCSYYRKFIHKFAHIAAPLHELTKGHKKSINHKIYVHGKGSVSGMGRAWMPEHDNAFVTLKQSLTTHPVLLFPDFTKQFTVIPDASGYAIGGVLCQDHGNGLQPVAYESRILNSAERRYPVHEQELLAILHCCKKWQHYLLGQNINVLTDHKPLVYLSTQPHLSNRQARWLDFLAEYNMHIEPIKGSTNIVGDAMSRRPDMQVACLVIIKNAHIMTVNIQASQHFHTMLCSIYADHINTCDNNLQDVATATTNQIVPVNALIACTTQEEQILFSKISSFYSTDKFVEPLINGSQKCILAKFGKYIVLNQLVYYLSNDGRHLLYIPESAKLPDQTVFLRQQLISEAHDTLYSGHFGTHKTLYKLQQQFYWPQIYLDVSDYCKSCISCQRNKPSNRKPLGLLQPMPVAFKPWQTVSMDFIIKLPKTVDGYDSIMVVVDQLTKRAHFLPTTGDVSAAGVAHLFFNNIWKHHGLPTAIISDRDSKFTSKFWKTLWALLGTKLAMSTAFSPQTDGQTERLNRTLEEYVRAYVDPITQNWSKLLAPAEYAYNSAKHESTGFSPFELDCGRQPNNPLFMFTAAARQHTNAERVINSLDDYLQQMSKLWQIARNALLLAQANQKIYHDSKHRHDEFYVGDEVFMSTLRQHEYGKIMYASHNPAAISKFEPRYLGPFKIVGKPSAHAYELDLPPSIKIHPVIHIRYLLRPREAKRFPHRLSDYKPPPTIINNEPEYEVEKILKKRVRKYGKGSRVEYLIHWKGYPSEEDTWEPLRSLTHCGELVKQFEADATIQSNCSITCVNVFTFLT